jgi:hypothetical protein
MVKKKDDKRVKTALYLDPDQVEALKDLQQTFPGINMSEHIRRAVALYIEQMREVAKKMPALPGAPEKKQ